MPRGGLSVDVRGDVKAITKSLGRIPKKVIVPSANFAINRTAATINTRVVRSTTRSERVPAKAVKKSGAITLKKSTFKTLTATITTRTRALNPVKWLGARELKRGGVSARGGHKWPKAFMAHGQHGNGPFVFERKGKPRLPIKAHKVRLDHLDTGSRTQRWINRAGRGLFRKNFEREAKRRTAKLLKRAV